MSDTGAPSGPPREGRFDKVLEAETGILVLRFHGPMTTALAHRALDSYSDPTGGFEARLRLWDLRGIQVGMSVAEIQAVARISQERDRRGQGRGRLALVVGDDLAYGLSRVHQVFRESEVTSQRVFRSVDDARAWLVSPED
jgi:hypothetical protein